MQDPSLSIPGGIPSRRPPLRERPQKAETLAGQAHRQLEEMIVTLAIPPGASLSQAVLVAEKGLGRTPIREAIKRLEQQGFVSNIHRRGLIVRDIKVEDQFAFLEILRPLDRMITCKATRRITSPHSEFLKRCADSMLAAAAEEDFPRFLHFDQERDQIIYEVARNYFAYDIVAPLYSHCRRFWCSFHQPGDLLQLAQVHANVILGVISGDEERAASASDALIDYMEAFSKAAVELM